MLRSGCAMLVPLPEFPQIQGPLPRLLPVPAGAHLPALVTRMADGDQDAMASLYDETSPLINGLLLRMLEYPEDAEEALLDVYMKAWKNAARYSTERGNVQAWLVVMARSIAIDRIRHKRALPKAVPMDSDLGFEFISLDADPEQRTVEAQRRLMIRAALHELPHEQRELLELAFFRGMTHSELARWTGQPLGTVKSRIRMAISRLRRLLEPAA